MSYDKSGTDEDIQPIGDATSMNTSIRKKDKEEDVQVTTLGGGCFWCLEAVYEQLNGVEEVVSGYAGGDVPNPTYESVCSGTTGHAEVIQVTYNPSLISFKDILQVFFTIHDPTTLNRQGGDVGSQYRSIILYHDGDQKSISEKVIAETTKNGFWDSPIVTEIAPIEIFYKAEEYHQKYFSNNPYQPYCQVVIEPKLAKFRKSYVTLLKQ